MGSEPRRRVGRPVAGRQRRERYLVTLEPAVADRARAIGNGNLSGGLARAVAAYAAAVGAAERQREQ